MYDLQHAPRRLLQETVSAILAASPPVSPTNDDDQNTDANAFDINARFNPSMAIILVVLLTAFFFMAFFSIYVKRCSSRTEDDPRSRGGGAGGQTRPSEPPFQGVDPAFLEALPLVAYSSSKKRGTNVECVVCLTDFEEGEPLCQLPRCKHVFHKDCIDMWLFSHTTCPLCRRSVISDSTRSFRWAAGSGSLRLSLGRRGSGRGSAAGTGPPTPIDGQARLQNVTDLASLNGTRRDRLPRSHSTGHSLVKQAQSTAVRGGLAEQADLEEVQSSAEGGRGGGGGCFQLTPPTSFQRSRSYAAGAESVMGIGSWMREAGATFKRALSIKRVSPSAAAAAAAASSSSSSSAAASAATPFHRMSGAAW